MSVWASWHTDGQASKQSNNPPNCAAAALHLRGHHRQEQIWEWTTSKLESVQNCNGRICAKSWKKQFSLNHKITVKNTKRGWQNEQCLSPFQTPADKQKTVPVSPAVSSGSAVCCQFWVF